MASHSTGCGWRKSSRCIAKDCVEVKETVRQVLVRDSKDPDGPALGFDRDAWRAFVHWLERG